MSEEIKDKNKEQNKEQNKESKEKEELIYKSGFSAFFLVILIILVNIGTLVTLIIYLNFLIDSKKYNFDKIGFTRLGKNKHLSLCGSFSCVDSWYPFFFNLIIFFILFFQEVVISSKWMRHTFIKRAIGDLMFFPKYVIRFITLFI